MLNFLSSLFQIETMITILVGMAAFATVLTVTAPFLETDRLKARMKSVGQERDRLRAAQRAQLVTGESAKLRDKVKKTDIATQLVEGLNLRKIFEAESSREPAAPGGSAQRTPPGDLSRRALRRAAGAWPPRLHLFLHALCRQGRPADALRRGRRRHHLRLLPAVDLPQEPGEAPPGFDQARLVGCARPDADLRRIGHGDRTGACSAWRARSARRRCRWPKS